MTTNPVQSRIQVIERPVAYPGKCAICGAVARPVVDWGLELEDYGAVYFCLDCIGQTATALGYVPGDEHASVLKQLDGMAYRVIVATERVKVFKDELAANYECLVRATNSDLFGEPVVINEDESAESTDDPENASEGQGSNEQISNPIINEGSASISSSSSNGSIFGFD